MRKTIILFLIFFIFWGTCEKVFASEEQSQGAKMVSGMEFTDLKIALPKTDKTVLPNGMKIYMIEDDKLPMVELSVIVRTGAIYDEEAKSGLAGLVGYVIKSGGSFSNSDDFHRILDEYSITFDAEIEMEFGEIKLSCLKEDVDIVLDLLSKILRNPQYNEETLSFCKKQVESALTKIKNSPNSILRDNFRKLVYGKFPYSGSNLIIGSRYNKEGSITGISLDTIKNIYVNDLIDFHKKYFCPRSLIIGITGDFNSKKMARKIKSIFSGWTNDCQFDFKIPSLDAKISAHPGIFFIPKEGLTQSTVIMGNICADKLSEDFFAVEVMGEILGGSFGARLPTEVRVKRGLAYSVNGYLSWNYSYPGMLIAFAQTKSSSTVEVVKVMVGEIRKLRDNGITEEELKRAKSAIENTFVFGFTEKNSILRKMMYDDYFNVPLSHSIDYCRNIGKVNNGDVSSVANKYLHPDKMTILVVGNPETRKDLEKEFNEVSIINIK